jgi:hypothetical protein
MERTKSIFSHRNARGLIALFRRRIAKSGLSVEKSRNTKKDSGFQQPNFQSLD